ncbi:MAG: gluconolaconase, partial [Bacteroidetes bacterium]
MKPRILFLILISAFVACKQGPSGSQTSSPAATAPEPAATDAPLTQAWAAEGLKTPEAVCYDPLNDVLYVSNINEGPGEKDNNGFISRLSPEGKILSKEWVTGLSAPKGMAISNGNLYVSDLTDLVEINIAEGKITQRFNAPKAQFLNDVASDAAGNIYISDSGTGEIYRLNKGKLEVWVKNAAIQGPNGLFIKDNSLLVGVESKILALDLET